jgi:heme/copper-type cytochrome/quinol oxidase subunit 2
LAGGISSFSNNTRITIIITFVVAIFIIFFFVIVVPTLASTTTTTNDGNRQTEDGRDRAGAGRQQRVLLAPLTLEYLQLFTYRGGG